MPGGKAVGFPPTYTQARCRELGTYRDSLHLLLQIQSPPFSALLCPRRQTFIDNIDWALHCGAWRVWGVRGWGTSGLLPAELPTVVTLSYSMLLETWPHPLSTGQGWSKPPTVASPYAFHHPYCRSLCKSL